MGQSRSSGAVVVELVEIVSASNGHKLFIAEFIGLHWTLS
jgi:hypothetical protein